MLNNRNFMENEQITDEKIRFNNIHEAITNSSEQISSTHIDKLAPALCKLQSELEPVKKNKEIKITSRTSGIITSYKSADFVEVYKVVQPLLKDNNFAFTDLFNVRPDGKLISIFLLLHSSGQWLKSIITLDLSLIPPKVNREGKIVSNPAQDMGSLITYTKKYGFYALLGIPFYEVDDDANSLTREVNHGSKVVQFNKGSKTDKGQDSLIKEYMQLCVEQEINPKEFAGKHNITSTDLESIKNGIKLLMEKQNENAITSITTSAS